MPTNRKLVFANDEIYHVFNRGVEKRPTFIDKRELNRALLTIDFYRFTKPPVKLSKFLSMPKEDQIKLWESLKKDNEVLVEIICFCLMPNHFHFMLKQKAENGISTFISNFTNSYTKYFNTKRTRIGPIFQGVFKSVHVGSDEQLIHVSRYIHLNPVASFVIKDIDLFSYPWSSLPDYLRGRSSLLNMEPVLENFSTKSNYKNNINIFLTFKFTIFHSLYPIIRDLLKGGVNYTLHYPSLDPRNPTKR